MEIRIAGIVPESVVDGPGIRFVVFVQGCPHNCPECHNPQSHDYYGGEISKIDDILEQIRNSVLIQGLTLSGGEPLCQAAVCAELAKQVKAMGKNVVLYSGYTFEKIIEMSKQQQDIMELLKAADILIDGPYLREQRDLKLAFRGSINQRIIDVPVSLVKEVPVEINI